MRPRRLGARVGRWAAVAGAACTGTCLTLWSVADRAPAAEHLPASGGTLHFEERRLATGSRAPFGVVAADLSGAGRTDLAVTMLGPHTLNLFVQSADGSFAARPGLAAGKVPRGVVARDLDGDGRLELLVAATERNRLLVYHRDDAGSWATTAFAVGVDPFDLAVADLNGDGHLDVAVANESNLQVYEGRGETTVLYGDGDGGFAPGPTLRGGTYPADIEAADFDRDGLVDLAVVNWDSRDVSLYFGAAGGFAPRVPLDYSGAPAYALAAADLDGDGGVDLVVGDVRGAVHVFENRGGRTFAKAAVLTAGAGLRGIVAADLDGDGVADIATANTAADSVSVFVGLAGGGFAGAIEIPVGTRPRNVAAADLDGDGRTDLVVTNGGSDDLSLLFNRPPR